MHKCPRRRHNDLAHEIEAPRHERESDLMSSRLLFASVLVLSADAAFLAPGASRVASRHRVAAAPSMTAEISKDTVDSLEVHILSF